MLDRVKRRAKDPEIYLEALRDTLNSWKPAAGAIISAMLKLIK